MTGIDARLAELFDLIPALDETEYLAPAHLSESKQ